jgi:hypothetical protein
MRKIKEIKDSIIETCLIMGVVAAIMVTGVSWIIYG